MSDNDDLRWLRNRIEYEDARRTGEKFGATLGNGCGLFVALPILAGIVLLSLVISGQITYVLFELLGFGILCLFLFADTGKKSQSTGMVDHSAPVTNSKQPTVIGHLVVLDGCLSGIVAGTCFDLITYTAIGSGAYYNTIQLFDPSISPMHTLIWRHNGVWFVQDRGSIKGTFVNNQSAREALRANPGDIVKIGNMLFTLST